MGCLQDLSALQILKNMAAYDYPGKEQFLSINGYKYEGDLTANAVIQRVCSESDISSCKDFVSPQQKFAYFTVISIILVIIILLVLYRRMLMRSVRRNLNDEILLEVRSQMNEYVALP